MSLSSFDPFAPFGFISQDMTILFTFGKQPKDITLNMVDLALCAKAGMYRRRVYTLTFDRDTLVNPNLIENEISYHYDMEDDCLELEWRKSADSPAFVDAHLVLFYAGEFQFRIENGRLLGIIINNFSDITGVP
jgi:hypothetical protein